MNFSPMFLMVTNCLIATNKGHIPLLTLTRVEKEVLTFNPSIFVTILLTRVAGEQKYHLVL